MTRAAAIAVTVVSLLIARAGDAAADSEWSGAPRRPLGFTLGIGAGWTLPSADILAVNTVGVRLRFPCGITLEPRLRASRADTTIDVGGIETETASTTVDVTGSARFPIVTRGKTDLLFLGGAAFSWSKHNPWGDDNSSRTTTVSLLWGLAIDYWISTRWALSFNATNPLVSLLRAHEDRVGDDTDTSTNSYGAIFDPTVSVMVHLFY